MSNRCPDCDRPSCPWFHRNDADRSADELGAAITDCHANAIDHHASLVGLVTRILGSGTLIAERGIAAAANAAGNHIDNLRYGIDRMRDRIASQVVDVAGRDALRVNVVEVTEAMIRDALDRTKAGPLAPRLFDALRAHGPVGVPAPKVEPAAKVSEQPAAWGVCYADGSVQPFDTREAAERFRTNTFFPASTVEPLYRGAPPVATPGEAALVVDAPVSPQLNIRSCHRATVYAGGPVQCADCGEWLHVVMGAPVSRDGGGR